MEIENYLDATGKREMMVRKTNPDSE